MQACAARMMTRALYDVQSADILSRLKWNTLETRCKQMKQLFMFKLLNDLSAPHQTKSFTKIKDNDNYYTLRNSETDLVLPGPKTNVLKLSFK